MRQFCTHGERSIVYVRSAPRRRRFPPKTRPRFGGAFFVPIFARKSVQQVPQLRSLAMHWTKELAYLITPKSGPMRRMGTLLDANRAISEDIPKSFLKRHHWFSAGALLVRASVTGADSDIKRATDELLKAVEREGWMNRDLSPLILRRVPIKQFE